MMIYNQIFKFCENAAPAGNPNPFRGGGQKKQRHDRALLRDFRQCDQTVVESGG